MKILMTQPKFHSARNPMFRSQFSEDIFDHKYAHNTCETMSDLANVLVEDVCQDKLSKEDKDQLKEYVRDLKFIPGGRYLYYAGRKNKFFNNCLSSDTRVQTDKGMVALGEHEGETLNVLSPVDGRYYPAVIHNHGKQKLQKITFASVKGHQRETQTVRATRNHHWILSSGEDTYDLRVGDVVPANTYAAGEDDLGFCHGYVYGDGTSKGQLRLCSDRDKKYVNYLGQFGTVTYPPFAKGDPMLYFKQKIDWKNLPSEEESPAYIASFIKGWLAADGSETAGCKLGCVSKEAIEWFREHAVYAGVVITGQLRSQIRDVTIGEYEYKNHELFIQNYAYGSSYSGFKVINIEEDSEEEVFCPSEPVHQQIVIDHNIHTQNCFLLKAEEDTREDWAELSKKVESCLMTGGGIGVDYSIYREKNKLLSSTGGLSSGPIPKMSMTNEIGRNVMQGGSRRSAMYASLNWKHGDIEDFLKVKNWYDMPVGKTGQSFGQVREDDFNFPCPLDMTNISVNYDTEWIMNYMNTGKTGSVFKENVKQALKTGEPGFSFNFFDKENETLRNACTEVTSEDDSDVCNLGSVNLGRIDSVQELKDVVELGIKFLMLGTLRAQLPYEKVDAVREKNRRLGLGLMGVHEWLLKKGYKYEVVPELHQWLSVYKGHSDNVSRSFSSDLDISCPVANRAIAPTGSIGILGGTSTGIEPIFAVSYKRRYLKGGTRWHYQYVVDSAAQELIDLYGVDPESIESALDLAEDYERRIKFQADVQDYVDMSISSTINLPTWGSKLNNEDTVEDFTNVLASYSRRLRGFTVYPNGSRGGQPLTSVPYSEAVDKLGEEFEEGIETHDICEITNHGGSCGV